jgi:hypothetical protein
VPFKERVAVRPGQLVHLKSGRAQIAPRKARI